MSHVTRTSLEGQKVKGQLARAGAYCGGFAHSLLLLFKSNKLLVLLLAALKSRQRKNFPAAGRIL